MPERTYKIGEAAQLLKLKTHVLRFWETEFSQLSPLRTDKGQRLYSEGDLALLKSIRHLLHERGLTIEGARKVLQSNADASDMSEASLAAALLAEGEANPAAPPLSREAVAAAASLAALAPLDTGYMNAEYMVDEETGEETEQEGDAAQPRQAFTGSRPAGEELLRYALAELRAIRSMLRPEN